MRIREDEQRSTHVLLLEPNAALRSAILTVLSAERYHVEVCDSLAQVLVRDHAAQSVALVAWQSMDGLLAEEHRHHLAELTRRLRLVVMVPRRWARLLESTDLSASVAGLVAKPFEAQELLEALQNALMVPVDGALDGALDGTVDGAQRESPAIQAS